MKIHAIWSPELGGQLPNQTAVCINQLLELLDVMDEKQIEQFINDQHLYENPAFYTWVYSKNPPELNDIKRELQKKIARSHHLSETEEQEALTFIGKSGPVKNIGLDFRNPSCFYCHNEKGLYAACRSYLKQEGRTDFILDMDFCFPNLYFLPEVSSSIHNLNNTFETIREEIVEHLSALDSYKDRFIQMSLENKGYRIIAAEFQKDTKIECSPQASRKKISALIHTAVDKSTNKTVKLNCELHTKFRRFNIDRTKQDRIYFAPARPHILSGKVVIAHIGQHL